MSDDSRQITVPFAACEDAPYIFASYAHSDKDRVFPILKELYEAGYNVWYDQGITIGTDYDRTIKGHITQSDVFLFFASNRSLSREYILDDELPPARESHSDDNLIALYLEDVDEIPDRAVGNMPKCRCESVEQVTQRLRSLSVKNFGRREAVPIERDVPPYWHDDYDLDPTGGTKNIVHTAEAPYVCLAFDPRDVSACNPYAKELLFAGYNVRSCENEDEKTRADMFADPDCAAYVPFLTKKYVESGQLERDYAASKKAKKPFIALYMQTFDNEGKEETYEVPTSIAKEFTAIQGLSIKERTVNDFLSELEADLEKRGCYASMKDGKVERRSFEIPGFLYDFTGEAENKRKGIVLTYITGEVGKVIIKRSYGGYPVREIGEKASSFNNHSITIPNTIARIGDSAFMGHLRLHSVYINDLVAWCAIKFEGSNSNPVSYAHRLYLNGEEIKELTIPDGVTSIGREAFHGCSFVSSVTIPDSVASMGERAFDACFKLTSVHINDLAAWCAVRFEGSYSNPLYYGHNLYLNNDPVKDLVIPDGVTRILDHTFEGCSGLTSVSIHNNVISIGEYAFSGCTGLTSVDIPGSVTTIGGYAFSKCSELTFVTLHSGVTSIGDYAFAGCTKLTSVIIPDSVVSIGKKAFYGCKGLISVTMGNGIRSIGEESFNGCTGLTSVYINNLAAWGSVHFDGYFSNPVAFAHKLYLNGEQVRDIIIPDGVKKISDYAFYGCKGLSSVTIENSVNSIGKSAFEKSKGLTSVNIPKSVTCIGDNAFHSAGLISAAVPASVTSIGKDVFKNCNIIVYCPEGSAAWKYCEENDIHHNPIVSARRSSKKTSRPGLAVFILLLLALAAAAGIQFSGLFDILGWLGGMLG